MAVLLVKGAVDLDFLALHPYHHGMMRLKFSDAVDDAVDFLVDKGCFSFHFEIFGDWYKPCYRKQLDSPLNQVLGPG